MLEITRQADYALRAVHELALLDDNERIATAEIARRNDIPMPFLAKIVSQLSVKGIVSATRGAGGGVRLARAAGTINMRQIIEAIDGPITINRCASQPEDCDRSVACPMCEVFVEVRQTLVERLEQTDFGRLAQRNGDLLYALN